MRMTGIEKANGHKPEGLLDVLEFGLGSVPRPKPEELSYDLDAALDSVLFLKAEAPSDAYTAKTLGTERQGNGIAISDDGLVLTIGYLITEATAVKLADNKRRSVNARVVAYDYDSGFGLVRALEPLHVKPLALGSAKPLKERDKVVIASFGGRKLAITASIVARREFAGRWEYLVDEAIFTAPPHPAWSGAALLDADGRLAGVGSLYVEDAVSTGLRSPGNMFVPIDLLPPIMSDLVSYGRSRAALRPYLAMFTAELQGTLVVSHVAPGGPAARAGIRPGDVVRRVNGEPASSLAAFYRRLWAAGEAGAEVKLGLVREKMPLEVTVRSADRYSFLKFERPH
jgi:S1-C subfamily serine protease